jgi:hypothetical protein
MSKARLVAVVEPHWVAELVMTVEKDGGVKFGTRKGG